jgi:hypothetical protein
MHRLGHKNKALLGFFTFSYTNFGSGLSMQVKKNENLVQQFLYKQNYKIGYLIGNG